MIAKTSEEIKILREGGRRLARHVAALSAMVRPGATPEQLEDKAREMVAADGDELAFLGYGGKRDAPFPAGLCVSVNDIIVHCPASENDKPFTDGDIVCIDFGIRHEGLFTDHATTVIAGAAKSIDDERLLRGTREALAAGIAAARVPNTIGHIGEAVERIALKYNFGFPRNLGGHGVGRAVHEEPHIHNFGKAGDGPAIVKGMVVAIEPMMTLGSGELILDADGHSYRTKDGSRTAHFEHTVLVTASMPEILTKE